MAAAIAAVRGNQADRLRELLAAHSGLASERYTDGGEVNFPLLYLATEWHRDECAGILLDAGADPNQASGPDDIATPLAKALSRGNARLAERMAAGREIPRTLRLLAGLGRLDELRGLFQTDGSLRTPSQPPSPPYGPDSTEPAILIADAFRYACRNGRRDTAAFLLDRALDLDPEAAEAIEAWNSRPALVQFLVERRHILHLFGDGTFWEWARETLDEAEPLNLFDASTPDPEGRTARDLADTAGHSAIVAKLDDYAAEPRGPVHRSRWSKPFNSEKEEAFLRACQSAHLQRIREFLADDPSLIRAEGKWGQNGVALNGSYGGYGRAPQATEILLEAGVDGRPALTWSAWWGGKEVIEAVLRVSSEVPDSEVNDALIICAAASRYNQGEPQGWLEPMRLLLDAGADPNSVSRWGETAWGIADDSLRSFLEDRGARPQPAIPARDEFFEAVHHGEVDRVLEDATRDARLREVYSVETHQSALLMALECGHDRLVEAWLSLPHDADLNEAGALGDTDAIRRRLDRFGRFERRVRGHGEPERPLHFAAWYGHLDAARLLIERGYSPGKPNGPFVDGSFVGPKVTHRTTPFHLAAARGHLALVELFLEPMRAMRRPG